MKRFITAMILLIACLLFAASQMQAQTDGLRGSGPNTNVYYGAQNPLMLLESYDIQGDYVAAGDGMFGNGAGAINLTIPAGSSLYKAYLFWAIIWDGTHPANTGELNSNLISGTLLGTSGSPCRGGDGIDFFWADATAYAISGNNILSGFPNGAGYPNTEGATLVLVFEHPLWDFNKIAVFGGATTFSAQSVVNNIGSYMGWTGGSLGDQLAQHTYIMSDGQSNGPACGTAFNGTPTSGPGTLIMPADAFPGADGNFWDSHTLDVSSFFPSGVSTSANPEASAEIDCITWGGHIISIKTMLHAFVDVKPGSCPNSFNVGNKGNLPVAILGSAGFDVSNIDPSTVMLNGVSPTGGILISDVSMPYTSFQTGCMDCNYGGPDMMYDLVLHFKSQDVTATLGTVATNDCIPVLIEGYFYDGTPFEGTDILRIINNSSPKDAPDVASFELQLEQNSPNPVTDGTVFNFTLPDEGYVQLAVYNMLGQRVATIVQGSQSAGSHSVNWNAISDIGMRLTPGVYMYRLALGTQTLTRKLIISK